MTPTRHGTATPGTLMLVDTASLYYRAFHGVPDRRPTPQDTPTNALRGFLDMLATLLTTYQPTHLVTCWDNDWRPAFRVAAVPSYKSHRLAPGSDTDEDTPAALAVQVPLIAAALDAVGICRIGSSGYEADDVIGTLVATTVHRCPGTSIDVVTGDRDLFQLVDDQVPVRVIYTARGGIRDPDHVDQAYLLDQYDVPDGARYADLAVLRGDPSDGLPGVVGIGAKSAASLLRTFGDLDGVIQAIDDVDIRLKGARLARLSKARDYLAVAPTVVDVVRDCPVPDPDGDPPHGSLPRTVADARLISQLAVQYQLTRQFTRLLDALHIT